MSNGRVRGRRPLECWWSHPWIDFGSGRRQGPLLDAATVARRGRNGEPPGSDSRRHRTTMPIRIEANRPHRT